MVLEKLYLPLWAQSCFDKPARLEYEELEDGRIHITNCKSIFECYGCNPIGSNLAIHPNRLEKVKQFDSMKFPFEELDGYYMTEEMIASELKEFKDSKEKFFWWRGIVCDLDTIRVWKIIAKAKESKDEEWFLEKEEAEG